METEVLIVGGGLSGLALATLLQSQGIDFQLVEARDRFGGRILSEHVCAGGHSGDFDLGPAWFWPGQPRIARLIQELGLKYFEQYAQGDLVFETETGQVQRGYGFASMQGSYRLVGGLGQLIDGLESQIADKSRLSLRTRVTHIEDKQSHIEAALRSADGEERTIKASKLVLAIPPRVAAATIDFGDSLPESAMQQMDQIPTWMAGHAKVLAVYDEPFWRNKGLSGDASSRRGPMMEIHDASPEANGLFGLFGFVGVPAKTRLDLGEKLVPMAVDQLVRLFGDKAAKPIEVFYRDWAFDIDTATALDQAPPMYHPAYGLPKGLSHLMNGRLLLGSTEVAEQFGGFLEGALESSETVFRKLTSVDEARYG